ncbi:Serine/threonine-protein kinase PknD [Candidatus Magnetaquicoccaceae bacterium FCR-1]|uniref:Serine/threonine-protein kinase PknD n=1 Tax=Candidatus Magnetaquiglobus chichijimensis TaxID=3141448 RepID=A0ABQ0CDF2_9PROT
MSSSKEGRGPANQPASLVRGADEETRDAGQGEKTGKNEDEGLKRARKESDLQKEKTSDDDYVFAHVLGKGGFGEVWLACYKQLSLMCAIKIIKPVDDQMSPKEFLASLVDEIRTIREVSNKEYLCQIHDLYVGKKGMGLVMDWLQGESLASWITNHESQILETLSERWRLFREIVRGVAGLHTIGFVHLDLKPENVFLEQRENSPVLKPKLIDLTNMVWFRSYVDKKQMTHFTPTYAAPEQIVCTADRLDFRCDIYSLGMIGYELFGGRAVIHEIKKIKKFLYRSGLSCDEDVQGFITIHKDFMDRNPPHAFLGVMPKPFNNLLLQMLDPEPEQRGFSQASEVDAVLAAMEQSHPMPWVDVEMAFAQSLFGDRMRIQIPAGSF